MAMGLWPHFFGPLCACTVRILCLRRPFYGSRRNYGFALSVCLSMRAFEVVAFSDRIAIDDYFKTSYGHMVTLKTHDLKMTDKENYLSGKCKSGK